MTDTPKSPPDTDLDLYIQAVLGKKAINPVVLDVRGLTSVSDFFINDVLQSELPAGSICSIR